MFVVYGCILLCTKQLLHPRFIFSNYILVHPTCNVYFVVQSNFHIYYIFLFIYIIYIHCKNERRSKTNYYYLAYNGFSLQSCTLLKESAQIDEEVERNDVKLLLNIKD